jgi:hypothetical protein
LVFLLPQLVRLLLLGLPPGGFLGLCVLGMYVFCAKYNKIVSLYACAGILPLKGGMLSFKYFFLDEFFKFTDLCSGDFGFFEAEVTQ